MAPGGVLNQVEVSGYVPNGHVAALEMRSKLRGLRDESLQPIFVRNMQESGLYELDGEPVHFPRNGSVDATQSLLIAGDWNQLVFSIRSDMMMKVLDQGAITNESGEIVYNLGQQDMVALRVIIRIGWQLPNPVNRINEDELTRYPFSVLTPV
jgi:hypothetical protein